MEEQEGASLSQVRRLDILYIMVIFHGLFSHPTFKSLVGFPVFYKCSANLAPKPAPSPHVPVHDCATSQGHLVCALSGTSGAQRNAVGVHKKKGAVTVMQGRPRVVCSPCLSLLLSGFTLAI